MACKPTAEINVINCNDPDKFHGWDLPGRLQKTHRDHDNLTVHCHIANGRMMTLKDLGVLLNYRICHCKSWFFQQQREFCVCVIRYDHDGGGVVSIILSPLLINLPKRPVAHIFEQRILCFPQIRAKSMCSKLLS